MTALDLAKLFSVEGCWGLTVAAVFEHLPCGSCSTWGTLNPQSKRYFYGLTLRPKERDWCLTLTSALPKMLPPKSDGGKLQILIIIGYVIKEE